MSTNSDPTNSSQDGFLDHHDMLKAGLTDPAVVALNISADDIATINSDNTLLHTKKSASDIADGAAQQATKEKDNAFKLGKANYRAIRQRIMKNAAYTPAIGELLGIELPEVQPAPGAPDQPVLHGKALVGGGAEIKSTKGGAEAVDIYSKRDNDADFVFLKRVMHFPYRDNRPLLVAGKPEKREYYGVFVRHDEPYGDASAHITVIVSA
jgi:hypothetical protein